MHKTVTTIVAASRILIRRPSEQKLASDDMRFLLHNILDELNNKALKRNRDYFTESELVTFTYRTASKAFEISLAVSTTLYEFYPVHLFYQDLSADPDTDPWQKVNRVKVAQFPAESSKQAPVYAMLETILGSVKKIRFRMNLTNEFVQEQRWRLDYRAFPTTVLQFGDLVPFPQEHTSLLENALAGEAIQLVKDASPDWTAFRQIRSPYLQMKVMQLTQAFEEWLDKDIENIIVTPRPYHYINNNAFGGTGRLNLRTEPQ